MIRTCPPLLNLIRFSPSVGLDTPVPRCILPLAWALARKCYPSFYQTIASLVRRPGSVFLPCGQLHDEIAARPFTTYTPRHTTYTPSEQVTEATLPAPMKTLRRLVDRIRGEGLDGPASLTNALPVVQTSEVTIPAASNDVLNEELKGWADESGVMLEPVDGVWWRYGDLDGTLTSAREGKGLVGLQFHGGGYSIGSAKDVLSGGSRKSSGCHEITCQVLTQPVCFQGYRAVS